MVKIDDGRNRSLGAYVLLISVVYWGVVEHGRLVAAYVNVAEDAVEGIVVVVAADVEVVDVEVD